ncbi:NTP transferase domain-containing protein [Hyperthermus butylicus]|uniref:Glucose-1-phosphate thymidylyltransferase n=1 Tax=Hyperthermus butylicus (strain DSM 5456 / JCM 9403 / PLM1-5) TaxID=415426 RepID=A2BLF1_HYPBU|nr:NTP transferase domain-containing protein [Hyperthermus butylicus]ABM80812.1 glucose-1-phosphate thymidylyltransferase [Hyperthermus butylicus DSM 5456]
MKAIILAGGPPKKLRYVVTSTRSRALLRFPGGVLLEFHLRAARRYFDTIVVVSDDPNVYKYCSMKGCNFVPQRSPGIEGAICDGLSGLSVHGEDLVTLIYSDIYFGEGFIDTHMNALLRSYEPLITVTKPVIMRETFLRIDADPISQQVNAIGQGGLIFAGLASLPAKELHELVCRGGKPLPDVLRHLAHTGRLNANHWIGEWVDIDTPWDYLLATRLALARHKGIYIHDEAIVKETSVLEPPVYIDTKAFIDHYAVIKGPVYIGVGARIGAHSFVRNYTAIYSNALVGAYTEVKRSIVYDSASISSHCYVADSIIGEEASLAPYTITLNTPIEMVSNEIILTTSYPLERVKVGAVIAARAETKPHQVLNPAEIYEGSE